MKINFKKIYTKYGMILIFIVVFVAAALINDNFIKTANLMNILRQITVICLLAFGSTFIILLGHIDVSYGSVVALTGCISASVMVLTQVVYLSILVAVALGALIGLIAGFLITKFHIQAFIVTLAITTIARGAVLYYTKGVPVAGMNDDFKVLGQGNIGFMPISLIVLILIYVISLLLLNRTKFGRYVYACGGNISAAWASGIKVNKVIIQAFVYNGILAGFAGVLLASRINSGQPAMGAGYEFDAITAVVVGGTSLAGGIGGLTGTIFGALIIGVINNIMNLTNVSSYFQMMIRGVIITIAVIIDIKTKSTKETVKI